MHMVGSSEINYVEGKPQWIIRIVLDKVKQLKNKSMTMGRDIVGENDLKLYVDYGCLPYYSAVHNPEQCVDYLEEMYQDSLPGRP